MKYSTKTRIFVEIAGKVVERTSKCSKVDNDFVQDASTGLWMKGDKFFVPEYDIEFKLKALISAHCGFAGHRGYDGTMSIVSSWSDYESDVSEFVSQCLHCLVFRTGNNIPRPLGHSLHGSRTNKVIHADIFFMGEFIDDKQKVLILKDDISGFLWLWPAESATSEVTCDSFFHWITSYGQVEWFYHFKVHI